FKLSLSLLCIFFFQAEDGIRDRNVTGVQTCALPIFYLYKIKGITRLEVIRRPAQAFCYVLWKIFGRKFKLYICTRLLSVIVLLRSEERRVGKECRSRWGAFQ